MTDTLMIHLITTNYFSVNKTKQIDGSEEMGDESKKGGKKLGLLWASKRASVHSFWKGDGGGDHSQQNRNVSAQDKDDQSEKRCIDLHSKWSQIVPAKKKRKKKKPVRTEPLIYPLVCHPAVFFCFVFFDKWLNKTAIGCEPRTTDTRMWTVFFCLFFGCCFFSSLFSL